MPVLYCYDGSPAATHALLTASNLLGNRPSVVLSVWLSALVAVADLSDDVLPRVHLDEIEEAASAVTQNRADTGALMIEGAVGISMEAAHSVWQSILECADECDAELIVLGARNLGTFKTLMLGSVSHAVVNHSRRPVLVVPFVEV